MQKESKLSLALYNSISICIASKGQTSLKHSYSSGDAYNKIICDVVDSSHLINGKNW